MFVPNPPTDNLYKFVFIAGIAAVLLATHEMGSQEQSYYKQADALQNASIEFSLDSISNEEDLQQIKKDIHSLTELCGCDADSGSGSFVSVPLGEVNDSEQVRMRRDIMSEIDRYNQSTRELSKKYMVSRTSKSAFSRFEEDFTFYYRATQVIAAIGILMLIFGGAAWYYKVQIYEDFVQRVAGLKARKELEELTNQKK